MATCSSTNLCLPFETTTQGISLAPSDCAAEKIMTRKAVARKNNNFVFMVLLSIIGFSAAPQHFIDWRQGKGNRCSETWVTQIGHSSGPRKWGRKWLRKICL